MIPGELCESCNEWNRGRYSVIECSVCKNDMCNLCANYFLCPSCLEKRENGKLEAIPEFEQGNLIGWNNIKK